MFAHAFHALPGGIADAGVIPVNADVGASVIGVDRRRFLDVVRDETSQGFRPGVGKIRLNVEFCKYL
ncbi:MAG: hypothetical protein OXC62_03495 [Aestuariivita sp.]|nr:hypothetical protein [Aestuariivita sp.]